MLPVPPSLPFSMMGCQGSDWLLIGWHSSSPATGTQTSPGHTGARWLQWLIAVTSSSRLFKPVKRVDINKSSSKRITIWVGCSHLRIWCAFFPLVLTQRHWGSITNAHFSCRLQLKHWCRTALSPSLNRTVIFGVYTALSCAQTSGHCRRI